MFLLALKKSNYLKSFNNEKGFSFVKMKKLFIYGLNLSQIDTSLLKYAIISGSIDIVKLLDELIDYFTFKSANALHFAAIFNQVEIGKLLIDRINVNSIDMQNHTPLMYAIKNHSNEFIKFLLNHPKIDINHKDILNLMLFLIMFAYIYYIFMEFQSYFF